jgi:hypothetical protein
MTPTSLTALTALGLVLMFAAPISVRADEGMWTFDNLPLEQLRERYGFIPTQAWLDHLRLASVRVGGASGSFVSPEGLLMTNMHVALGYVQSLSGADADYVTNGFYATTRDDELRAPNLEVSILVSIEEVTGLVREVAEGLSDADGLRARQAEIARIEQASNATTGLSSNVTSLYNGGEYWLYRYRRYRDVRLVFSPENQAAFFGGDTDNFTYPRYCLDVAFFRVYEDGAPATTPHYLIIKPQGPDRHELVFVSGNPGSTDRLFTYDQLLYQRDVRYPTYLDYLKTYRTLVLDYAAGGVERARRVQRELLGIENSLKAMGGEHRGLRDPALMRKLKVRDDEFRGRIADTANAVDYGTAFTAIATATQHSADSFARRVYRGFVGSGLATSAGTIVRYVNEVEKPDAERLPGYHESELEALRFRLLSTAPVYTDLEAHLVAGFLEKSRAVLGTDDPWVAAVLGDSSPQAVATRLLEGTRLAEVEFRRQLIEGGRAAVEASDDPLIVLTRELDPQRRWEQQWFRDKVESVLTDAGETLATARFDLYGRGTYPDATGTLRIAFGTVSGYPMNGTRAPHETTLYGLFDRAVGFGNEGDFALPQRYWERRKTLNLSTPANFVTTADIIGGNSGSPVVNRDGALVGLIFDGNIESLVGRYAYDEERARSVVVHPAYILEALSRLYDADALVKELTALSESTEEERGLP